MTPLRTEQDMEIRLKYGFRSSLWLPVCLFLTRRLAQMKPRFILVADRRRLGKQPADFAYPPGRHDETSEHQNPYETFVHGTI
jgi:hypothetical protein